MNTTPNTTAPAVGLGAVETMVTDTRCFVVTKVTASTITIAAVPRDTEHAYRDEYVDQGPLPVVHEPALLDQPIAGTERVLRRRKDGTYRTGEGARPLRF